MPTWSVALTGDLEGLKGLVPLGVGVTEEADGFRRLGPNSDRVIPRDRF